MQSRKPDQSAQVPRIGILGALDVEMQPIVERLRPRAERLGVSIWEGADGAICAAVCGVGKVAAAHGALALLAAGCGGLLMVGTGGGVSADLKVGDLVHGSGFVQADLAVREGRESAPDPVWKRAWMDLAGGVSGLILSADRPVMGHWARSKLRRAYSGTLLADMEAAAASAVCQRAGVPFAALKVVTDRAGIHSKRSFGRTIADEGGRAALSLLPLIEGDQAPEARAAFPFPDGYSGFSG